jgi:glycosyltransferase involved in cell wall biosynthesis
MTVSVVIPCFNQARFLGDAIDSALAQQNCAVEVIVVDDGSTDDSAAVASAYGSRIGLVRQRNSGLSRARNAGLAVSTGEVVIFLDADDRLLPGAATSALRAFGRHPLAAMVFGRCELIDAAGDPLPTTLPVVGTNHYQELLEMNFIWMPAMAAFRRATLAGIGGFDPAVNASADYDIYLRVARVSPVSGHDALVAQYRQHGANMSADPALMLDTSLRVLRSQHAFVQDDPDLRAAYERGIRRWREFYGERLVERFRAALHEGRRGAAARDAWRLLRLYPAGVRQHLGRKAMLTARHLVTRHQGG